MTLRVVEDGPALHWVLELKNEADVPARLVADPHLLWFEVKVPGRAKKTTCRLPEGLFPKKPDDAARVELQPGDRVVHRFDPRLYCFSEKGQWQLVPGSQVTPHFGWPQKMRTRYRQGHRVEEPIDEPPHAVRVLLPGPVSSAETARREPKENKEEPGKPWKEIVGPTFALSSSYAEWAITRLPDDDQEAPLALTLTHGSDADFERNTSVALKLKNESKEGMHVFFRRELVSFEVMGPDGLRQCDADPDDRAPDRGGFSRLGPGRSMTIYSRLVELCPRGTFAYPGLYLINARFDSRESGEEYELDAFVGRVVAKTPVTVRINKGDEKLNLGGMSFIAAPR